MATTQTPYRVKATFLETCNCDAGCNCNFGGFPDHGACEALIGIRVDEGQNGDVDLAGVKVVLAVKWPKAIHEGDGAAAVFIDESASEAQVGGIYEARLTPLINPVTGEENEVDIVFPGGGLIFDVGHSCTTSVMNVSQGDIKFDYTGQSAFFAPVEWTNQ